MTLSPQDKKKSDRALEKKLSSLGENICKALRNIDAIFIPKK